MKNKKKPQRMCVACRDFKDKNELIRIVKNKEEGICLDATGKKAGRGAYLCYSEECLAKARKSRSLEKVLSASIGEELYEELAKRITEKKTKS